MNSSDSPPDTPGTASRALSLRARVHVFPRREILDPQGRAIHQTSARLGFASVRGVRAGKAFDIELDAASEEEALALLGKLAQELLSNPITEDYAVEILAGDSA